MKSGTKQIIFIFILLCMFQNSAKSSSIPPKNELDSVRTLVNSCNNDTGKYHILSSLFWTYWHNGNHLFSFYGNWAYEVIKNSYNIRNLTDGNDIKINLLIKEGKNDSAKHLLLKNIEFAKRINYTWRLAWSYFGMGEIENIAGKTQLSTNYFRLSKNVFLSRIDTSNAISANWNIAENYKKMRNYDSAIYFYKENYDLEEKRNNIRGQISSAIEISKCYNTFNNIKKSTEYINSALELTEKSMNKDVLISVYSSIGDLFYEQRKNNLIALEYYTRALSLSEEYNYKKDAATLMNQIGRLYLDEGNTQKALKYNLNSLKIATELNLANIVINSYSNLGFTHRKIGNLDTALSYFTKCINIKDYFACQAILLHDVYLEIGDIYLNMKQFDKSLFWYNKSLTTAISSNSNIETIKSYFHLGNCYSKFYKYGEAENNLNKSYQLAIKANNLLLLKDIADTLSNFYLSKADYRLSDKYQRIARSLNDSLRKAENLANIANLEIKFELDKIQVENKEKEYRTLEKIKKQNYFLYTSLVIIALLALVGILIFRNYRRKKQDNILLLQQKQELEIMSKKVHDADQGKIAFFTNISHELRTPLTLIITPLMKLIKENKHEDLADNHQLMLRNTRKLQSLINQILDISKLDKGELKLNKSVHDFNKHIQIIAAMFQSLAEENNIKFKINEKHKNLLFEYDYERVEQVINNLLSNAFKFTPNGGTITIQINELQNNLFNNNDKQVELKVRDTGIGIPAGSIDKIFNRFYQCDSSISRNFEGSGLGLSVAKEIVELHNGKIIAESVPGKWTEFSVILPMPVCKSEETTVRNPEILDAINAVKSDLYSHKSQSFKNTILVVEDNKDLQQYLSSSLSEYYNVVLAGNGTTGIELAKRHNPDIIISDVMMPETDGYQLTSHLKSNLETSHIPIILLTAKSGRDDRIEGLERGADDYISKPFDEEELILKIKNLLNNQRILQQKYRRILDINPTEIDAKSIDEQFLIKLTQLIEREISNPDLDVEFLCSEMNLSGSQLYRKLKSLTNISINHFIRSIRLKRAAQLLTNKAASVSEIAYMTGFENLSYFSKKFREEFKMLPSEFILKHEKQLTNTDSAYIAQNELHTTV